MKSPLCMIGLHDPEVVKAANDEQWVQCSKCDKVLYRQRLDGHPSRWR